MKHMQTEIYSFGSEFKGSSKEPAPQPKIPEPAPPFLQGSSLEELEFARFQRGEGGGGRHVARSLLHDLIYCTQALQTKIKCNTACRRRQKYFAYNSASVMSSHSLSMSRSSAIKSRDAKASCSVC